MHSKVEGYTSTVTRLATHEQDFQKKQALVAASWSFNYRPLNKIRRLRRVGTQQLLLTDQEDQDCRWTMVTLL